jgi:hypothetical protein
MTTTIRVPRALRDELIAAARDRLMQALDAVSHSPPGPPADPPELGLLLLLPLAEIPPELSRDAHWVLTRDPAAGRDPIWDDVCRRTEALGRELESDDLPATAAGRQARLMNLTFFTAAVMVPLLAERGAYRRAVRLAEAVRRLVTGEAHRLVLGAGAEEEGADPRMRFLALSPVFWSLAAFHPAGRPETEDDR